MAKIISWNSQEYIGRIVQRYEATLIVIGRDSGNSFTTVLKGSRGKGDERNRVEVLPDGTLIRVVRNQ